MKAVRNAMLFILALATTTALAQSDAQKSFDKLKSLAGTWQGKDQASRPVQVSYRVTSGGSALMSEIQSEEDMITMFHLDGDRLLMTHYCGAGNQPRMKASASPDGKTITFEFLDATNLPTPQTGHMHRVVFNLIDANHHTEEWTFLADGKEVKELFDLQRKS
ncbi:MAG TPA: hypothetical protein VEV41_18470 [Terriglobales bacterium]|jgi:hypothetical protein|nr:hypothetical protein [Terriglobales bacterium]